MCGGFYKYTLSAVYVDGSNPSPGGYDAGEGEEEGGGEGGGGGRMTIRKRETAGSVGFLDL
jgi:hypothetical protein